MIHEAKFVTTLGLGHTLEGCAYYHMFCFLKNVCVCVCVFQAKYLVQIENHVDV